MCAVEWTYKKAAHCHSSEDATKVMVEWTVLRAVLWLRWRSDVSSSVDPEWCRLLGDKYSAMRPHLVSS